MLTLTVRRFVWGRGEEWPWCWPCARVSTTRFEMGDDDAFTINVSADDGRSVRSPGPSTTYARIYVPRSHSDLLLSHLCFYPKITRSRWREMDEIAVIGAKFSCLDCRTRLVEVCLRYLHVVIWISGCLDL